MSEIAEEVRKALEAATPGPWESTNLGDVHITKGYRMVDGRHTAMWIADMCEDREDEEQIFADAWLIANAPTWLRTLLEENEELECRLEAKDEEISNMKCAYEANYKQHEEEIERLTKERDEAFELAENHFRAFESEKKHAELGWEQSNKWLEENGRLRAELDQVKKDAERYKRERDFLTSDEYEGPGGIASRAQDKFAADIVSLRTELAEKDKVLEWIRDAGTDYQSINKAQEVLSQYKGDTTNASKDA